MILVYNDEIFRYVGELKLHLISSVTLDFLVVLCYYMIYILGLH